MTYVIRFLEHGLIRLDFSVCFPFFWWVVFDSFAQECDMLYFMNEIWNAYFALMIVLLFFTLLHITFPLSDVSDFCTWLQLGFFSLSFLCYSWVQLGFFSLSFFFLLLLKTLKFTGIKKVFETSWNKTNTFRNNSPNSVCIKYSFRFRLFTLK